MAVQQALEDDAAVPTRRNELTDDLVATKGKTGERSRVHALVVDGHFRGLLERVDEHVGARALDTDDECRNRVWAYVVRECPSGSPGGRMGTSDVRAGNRSDALAP